MRNSQETHFFGEIGMNPVFLRLFRTRKSGNAMKVSGVAVHNPGPWPPECAKLSLSVIKLHFQDW